MTKNKLTHLSLGISIFYLIIAMILHYRGFEIMTFSWHVLHPSPIEWNGVKIDVPTDLIGRYENEDFMLYKLEDPYELTMIFKKLKAVIGYPFTYESFTTSKNINVVEKRKVQLSIGDSYWIKAIDSNCDVKYLETVYLLSAPIRISFRGKESNRHIFENIVMNLSN
jgi:hypothetical protein